MNSFASSKYTTAEFDAIFRTRMNHGDTSAVRFLNLLTDIEQAGKKDSFQSSTFDKHFRHTFSQLDISTKSLMNYLLLNDFISSFILENKYRPNLQNSVKIWIDTLSQFQDTTLLPALERFKQEALLSLPKKDQKTTRDKLCRLLNALLVILEEDLQLIQKKALNDAVGTTKKGDFANVVIDKTVKLTKQTSLISNIFVPELKFLSELNAVTKDSGDINFAQIKKLKPSLELFESRILKETSVNTITRYNFIINAILNIINKIYPIVESQKSKQLKQIFSIFKPMISESDSKVDKAEKLMKQADRLKVIK